MGTETNKVLIQRFYEDGINQHNLDALNEFMAPDLTSPLGDRAAYQDAARTLFTAFPDYRQTIDDILADGDKVVVRWTLRGTHQGEYFYLPPSGKQVSTTGIEIFRLAEGKIVEVWFEVDLLRLLEQLGAFPEVEQIEALNSDGSAASEAAGPALAARTYQAH